MHANSSGNLELTLTVRPLLLGLGRRLDVRASCLKHGIAIEDAYVGCPQCNAERPGVEQFLQALENSEDTPPTKG
ncbi:MAG: hypothetical protein U0670_00245 [Anaerolineae bacterium]